MKNKIIYTYKSKKAFTLIELLAVIIILGVIMLIAIPSVTRYINDSRKKTYVDTAKQYVKGAINMVNSGDLDMYDTSVTYYIPSTCVSLESGGDSPFGGEFSPAYILVTYNNDSFNFYWMSTDKQNVGVKRPTSIDSLDINSIETGVTSDDVRPVLGIDGRNTIIEFESDCSSRKDPTAATVPINGKTGEEILNASIVLKNKDDLYPINDNIQIFNGGNPKNYVRFNQQLWRIIGIYGNKIKIISTVNSGYMKYQEELNSWINQGDNRNNPWPESDVAKYLNNEYYNSLLEESKRMISEGEWFVGRTYNGVSGHGDYTGYDSFNDSKQIIWNGKVALLTAYEFHASSSVVVRDKNCFVSTTNEFLNFSCGNRNKNWLTATSDREQYWTLTPSFDHPGRALYVTNYSNASLHFWNGMFEIKAIYPVVYLNESVIIVSGDGTIDNPYNLSM